MRLTQALAEDAETIVEVVKSAAREGNMQAIALILGRIAPPLKAQSGIVEFDFDPNGSPAEMSAQILTAVSKGQLDPDTGKMMLDMVATHISVRDAETFADELAKLESRRKNRIPGNVVHEEATEPNPAPTSH